MALNQIPQTCEYVGQGMRLGEELDEGSSISSLGVRTGMWPSVDLDDTESVFGIRPRVQDRIPFSFQELAEKLELGFESPPKPWLPPEIQKKIDKMKRKPLGREEMVEFIENIADISADFYNVSPGKFIAVKFDGRIVESADTQIGLLLKIQGKNFEIPVFVWEVGAESFSGWRL